VRVWVDLANSPQPILFEPIVRELERHGHDVVISTRDHAQTLDLTRQRWPDAVLVGGSSPRSRAAKLGSIAGRARGLAAFARTHRPAIAVSHNSYAQALAARALGIPCVTAMDYEHQPANHVAFRCAQRVLVPGAFPERRLRAQGARRGKVWRYEGLKEEIYLHDFTPDAGVLSELGLTESERFVVARPSPAGATYHQFDNPVFDQALDRIVEGTDLRVVLLARRPDDARGLRAAEDRIIVPERPVDARSLVYFSAALLGAGGTMNREAALIGVPTLSVYAGRLAAVDRELVREGRLHLLADDPSELDRRLDSLGDPTQRKPLRASRRVLERFVQAIETPLERPLVRIPSTRGMASEAASRP
jgi:uncharacterized protein